jgi:hypothetical protein
MRGEITVGKLTIYNSNKSSGSIEYDGSAYLVTNKKIKATDFYITSDRRVKSHLQEIDNALDKVKDLKGYTYYLEGVIDRSAGIIAQDVQGVLPEAVNKERDGMLSVSPNALIGLLVNAINEMRDKLDNLESEVRELKQGR